LMMALMEFGSRTLDVIVSTGRADTDARDEL
jgi:hypothetical protein